MFYSPHGKQIIHRVINITVENGNTVLINIAKRISKQSSSYKTLNIPNSQSRQSSSQFTTSIANKKTAHSSLSKQITAANNSTIVQSPETIIEVQPIKPRASFTYTPPTPVVNQTVTFDASSSTPNGGVIISYQWDFGDGTTAEGVIVTHKYSSTGNYTVTLNVTDNEGAWNATSKTITVYPIGNLAIEIVNITITDQNGNPRTTFTKGEIVQFNFTIKNVGDLDFENGLVSIMILDPFNTPIFLSYSFETIIPGSIEQIIIGYRIPMDVPLGTYTVKIMVFTDWPSKGGVGLDVETSMYEVT